MSGGTEGIPSSSFPGPEVQVGQTWWRTESSRQGQGQVLG